LQCFAVGLEPLIINAQSQLSASLTSWLVISKRERGQCPPTFSLVCYFRLMDSGITVSGSWILELLYQLFRQHWQWGSE